MRYRLSDLVFSCDRALPELDEHAGTSSTEVDVRWRDLPWAGPAHPYFEWRTPSGGHWLTFARDGAGRYLLTFTTFATFAVSPDASQVDVHPADGTPEPTVRHLLLNQVLPLVLGHRGRVVLHAAAVSVGGRACAFIGRSGAGKSTLAAAVARHAGGAVISDDCLVLHQREGAWWAVPSGAGMRVWPETLTLLGFPATAGRGLMHFSEKRRLDGGLPGLDFAVDAAPLAAIVALRRPDDAHAPTRARALTGREAVLSVASEVFRLDPGDAAASRAHFVAVTALAQSVPIFAHPRQPPAAAVADVLCRMAGNDG